MQSNHVSILALVTLVGCGGGGKGNHPDAGPDSGSDAALASDAPDGGAADAFPEDVATGSETSTVDAQAEAAADAGPTCAPLGAACTTAATCLCGLGAGCTDDNVACTSGHCTVAQLPVLDGGLDPVDECCATCQYAYDTGGTMSAWLACNEACGAGACPVTCLAEVSP